MTHKYVIPKFWRIVGLLSLPTTFGLSIQVFLKIFKEYQDNLLIPIIFGTLALAILFYVFTEVRYIFRAKLIIRDRELEVTRHNTQVISFNDVKGYRIDQNYIYLVLKNETKSNVPISRYFEKWEEWSSIISNHFDDLEVKAYNEEIDTLLTDTSFGQTSDERVDNILRVKKYTQLYNGFGLAVALWILFFPHPIKVVVALGIGIPLLAIIWVLVARGGIKTVYDDNSPYPSLNTAIAFPILGLFVLAISKYTLADNFLVWTYTFPISIAITFALIKRLPTEFTTKFLLDRVIVIPLLMGFSSVYLYSVITALNCAYDNGEPTIVSGKLVEKSNDKKDSYELSFQLPGKDKTYSMQTTEKHFAEVQLGDDVLVRINTGALAMPWIQLIVIEQPSTSRQQNGTD